MNILLVDDNRYVLNGMLDGIDFQRLGMEQVFTALNARIARECMQSHKIEIVITDIEMPNGSGLELLQWINENYPQTVTLFCTSYADFNYAQEAVRMKCFDYYLKPIQYQEFTEHVHRAVAEVKKRESQQKAQTYSQYWLENQWNMKQNFWYSYLYSIEEYTSEELAEIIRDYRLPYDKGQKLGLCVIKIGDDSKLLGIGKKDKDFILRNISSEIFTLADYTLEALLLTANHTVTVVLGSEDSQQSLRRICEEFVENLQKYIASRSNCYYRENIRFDEAYHALREMEEIALDDISQDGAVFNYDHYIEEHPGSIQEYAGRVDWEQFMKEEDTGELLDEIYRYTMSRLQKRSLSSSTLREIRSLIIQVTGSILQKNKLESYHLYNEAFYDELFAESVKSVNNMKKFAEYMVNHTAEYVDRMKQSQDTVTKVIRYLEQNYSNVITRDELESLSYMNIDHLSRQFKAKTGTTLHHYLIDYRIGKAAELLKNGQYTVSEVASMVGYDNYSYFSRLFKEKMGVSPKDYS